MEYSDSEDMASQQLLAEVQASAKKVLRPPTSSAAQSAALLNAARVAAQPPSSPSYSPEDAVEEGVAATMDGRRGNGGGKLKRPSLLHSDLAKRPKSNLARRGDPFEIQSSPEKPPAKPKPRSSRRSKMPVEPDVLQDPEPPQTPPGMESSLVAYAISPTLIDAEQQEHSPVKMPFLIGEFEIPAEPQSRKRKAADRNAKSSRRSKSPRVEAIAGAQINTAEDQSEHEKGTEDRHQGPENEPPQSAQKPPEQGLEYKQQRKPRSGKMVPLKAVSVANGLDIPSDREDLAKKPAERGPPSPEIPRLREKKPRPSKALLDRYGKLPRDQDPETREPTPTGEPAPKPARREGRVTRSSNKASNSNEASATQKDRPEPAQTQQEPSEVEKATTAPVTRSKSAAAPSAGSVAPESSLGANADPEASDDSEDLSDLEEAQRTESANVSRDNGADAEADKEQGAEGQAEDGHGAVEQDDEQDGEQDGEQDDQEGQGGEGQNEDLSDLDRVFNFLDSNGRDGRCQTADALAITQACTTALEVLQKNDTIVDEIVTITRNMQQLLARYGTDADGTQRRKFKSDAYAYLFRHLVRYLEVLHDWLREKYGDVESSADALRITVPFIASIVSLKDRIADWKVHLSSRYKGDALIKEVIFNVIVPLRRVEAAFRATLRTMQEAAQRRRAHEEALRVARERQDADQRKYEFEELKRKKQIFWIDLHVCRLKAERDFRRQQALAMNQEYFDEQMERYINDTDANGMRFERVDVFKKRVAPPPRPSAFLDQKEWTDEQMKALIEGLTVFSGPYVFHRIFDKYCGYARPLRRFGVPEITAKAAEVRGQLLATYQEQAWGEPPAWITKIPVLP